MNTCIWCAKLTDCQLLRKGKNKSYNQDAVFLSDGKEGCSEWEDIGYLESELRERCMDIAPELDAVHAIHFRTEPVLEDPEEEEEIDLSEVPDFVGMLYEGITVEDRNNQIRYQTDDEGNLVTDEDGRMIPRGNFAIRGWAIAPGGPLHQVRDSARLWDTNQLVSGILKVEGDAGLYADVKSAKKTKKKKRPDKSRAVEEKAVARKVVVQKKKPGSTSRVSSGPATSKKKVTKKKTGKKTVSKKPVGKKTVSKKPIGKKTVSKKPTSSVSSKKAPRKKAPSKAKTSEPQETEVDQDLHSAIQVELAELREGIEGLASNQKAIAKGLDSLTQLLSGTDELTAARFTVLHDIICQKVNEHMAAAELWDGDTMGTIEEDGEVYPQPTYQNLHEQGLTIDEYLGASTDEEEEEDDAEGEGEEEEEYEEDEEDEEEEEGEYEEEG